MEPSYNTYNTDELIDSIRKNPILYDTSHPDYVKMRLKAEIWTQIAKKLNMRDGNAAKNAWAKLRNCYRESVRRQRRAVDCGSPASTLRQWKYQKQMKFLIPYMVNKPPEGCRESDTEEYQEDTQFMPNANFKIESNINQIEMENEEIENIEENGINEIDENIEYQQNNNPINHNSSAQNSIRASSSAALVQQQQHAQQPASDDHLYHFFMSMYEITKKMPPKSQHMVKNNVFQAVSQAEADLLNIDS